MKSMQLSLQSLFLTWIFAIGASTLQAQVDEQDSLVLVTLYNALDGPNWDDNTGWLEGPVEDWTGIVLQEGRVVEINLYNNSLTGALPAELGQLAELRILSLYINNLAGEIPDELGNLGNLEELVISKNDLTGQVPASLSQLVNLKRLVLLDNQLVGPLPDLSTLQLLTEFVVGRNDFAGPFPEWTLNLANLRFLGIARSGLTGEVPEQIFSALSMLDHLRIGSNELEGDIARWFKDMTPMQSLDIYDNNFTGEIPAGVIDPELRTFIIEGNAIEGIPDFSTATEMKSFFYIADNKLGFHELEKALAVETFDSTQLRLGPQKPLMDGDTMVIKPGEDVTINSGSMSDLDVYQWYKDGVAIPGANARDYVINGYAQGDAGIYHCVISHPDFDFDLERSPVTLETDAVSSTREISEPEVTLYPNPASDQIKITGQDILSVSMYDMHGKRILFSDQSTLTISTLQPGLYIAKIETEMGAIIKRVTKAGM